MFRIKITLNLFSDSITFYSNSKTILGAKKQATKLSKLFQLIILEPWNNFSQFSCHRRFKDRNNKTIIFWVDKIV